MGAVYRRNAFHEPDIRSTQAKHGGEQEAGEWEDAVLHDVRIVACDLTFVVWLWGPRDAIECETPLNGVFTAPVHVAV